MSDLGTQASAIEAARRVILGGTKPPKPGSAEATHIAARLNDAIDTIRKLEAKTDG